MATTVHWRTTPLLTGLHAAEALARNMPLTDARLADALQQPANQLATEINASRLPTHRFWNHLIPLSATVSGRRQLVETAVAKTIGRGPRFEIIVTNLAACVAAIETALQSAIPELADELSLRERPLREQWDARGPGMLLAIGHLTEEGLLPTECHVVPVLPALGGDGHAHLAYNSARIEAVLANPHAELPEIVRLAWLLAQLQLDLPIHSESIHADRLPHIARFAMLPAALAAAEQVELARFTQETVSQAIIAWRLAAPAGSDAASLVMQWWETYLQTRPPFRIALAALDQMFD
jgi:hypothetical protein